MSEENQTVLRKLLLINNNLIWVAIVLAANAFIFSVIKATTLAALITLGIDLVLLVYWRDEQKKLEGLI